MNRCLTCPRLHTPVYGDGPKPARVMLIGERPGREENKAGIPFMGQSGQEQNQNYFPLAGLDRHDVYVTNACKCYNDQNKKPTDVELSSCSLEFIPSELMEVSPDVVILAGASACSLAGEIDLEAQHGIPFRGSVMGYECWVVPVYHPAAGMHRTTLMIDLLEDWAGLRPWLESMEREELEWFWPVDTLGPKRDYRLGRTKQQVIDYFLDYPINEYFGGDTESHDGVDFSMQVTTKVGTGLMVLCDDHEAIEELAQTLMVGFGSFFESTLILHTAEADLQQFERLVGFMVRYIDTQQMAYHLQNQPQGLKALSYRLLGRKRQSWKELVGGYSRSALTDWLWWAREIIRDEINVHELRFHKKTGKPIKPKIHKSPLEKMCTHLIGQINKPQNPDKPYDPWEYLSEFKFSAQGLIHMDELIHRLGPVPKLGIKNVPLEPTARDYGCSDSDDALAVFYELQRLKLKAQDDWGVVEGDWDRQHEIIDLGAA